MGKLVNCCAGISIRDAIGPSVSSVLLNVIDNCSTPAKIEAARRLLRVMNPGVLVLDSGGFHLLTAEGKFIEAGKPYRLVEIAEQIGLGPKTVVQAAKELRPTILMALDFPLLSKEKDAERKEEFKRKIDLNVAWTMETARMAEEHKLDSALFVPVQCYDLEQLDSFLKQIKGARFSGLSMPVRNMTPQDIAGFFTHFHKVGVKNIHILGTSAIENIAMAAYAARHLFDWVSIDATSWKKAGIMGGYLGSNLQMKKIATMRQMPECGCPFCGLICAHNFFHLPKRDQSALLIGHNYWTLESVCKELKHHSETPAGLIDFLISLEAAKGKIEKLEAFLSEIAPYVKEIGHRFTYST